MTTVQMRDSAFGRVPACYQDQNAIVTFHRWYRSAEPESATRSLRYLVRRLAWKSER